MKKTPTDKERPLKQKTMDLYKDQCEFLPKLAKKMNVSVGFLVRAAIDQQYNLPKKPKTNA